MKTQNNHTFAMMDPKTKSRSIDGKTRVDSSMKQRNRSRTFHQVQQQSPL
jgi:hypothetical protein